MLRLYFVKEVNKSIKTKEKISEHGQKMFQVKEQNKWMQKEENKVREVQQKRKSLENQKFIDDNTFYYDHIRQ